MNTKEMTLQDVFNTAYIGLQAQGFEHARYGLGCAYRGDDGRKCAIGHCIADEDYKPEMEGYTAGSASISKLFPLVNVTALIDLQRAHDLTDTTDQLKNGLIGFAKMYSLTIPTEEGKTK